MTPDKRQAIARDLATRGLSIRAIATQLGVSPGTIHRDLNPKAAERYRIASREHRRKATTQE